MKNTQLKEESSLTSLQAPHTKGFDIFVSCDPEQEPSLYWICVINSVNDIAVFSTTIYKNMRNTVKVLRAINKPYLVFSRPLLQAEMAV